MVDAGYILKVVLWVFTGILNGGVSSEKGKGWP